MIPRVNITSVTNNTTPVVNPAEGLLVFNNGTTTGINKSLYYWDNNELHWDYGLKLVETPLVATYTLNTVQNNILDNAGNGSSFSFHSNVTNPFTIEDSGNIPGFDIVLKGGFWVVTLPEGKYIMVASVELNLDNPNPTTQGTPLYGGTAGSGTYLNGVFMDLFTASYDFNTGAVTSGYTLNQRSEQYVVATVNQPHHLIYVVENIYTTGGVFYMAIGRSSGTSVNDTMDIIPNKTVSLPERWTELYPHFVLQNYKIFHSVVDVGKIC
ncbi:hypothetical protein CHRY9390_03105 [Chryseobacterium aquaeductus]|uniref:Uncharacterized protein n=1 Tax=Chryseobacterium aquaeductus TaxID=2675056 RepID=A0A9N8QW05_9FLAO|nr:hypothetical protein [Chryseobacterium aquaeductus]CAA7332383.1 hypothetical protein CHRY9390_03105 [Chryseobacterium potabilaquae]CAD7816124.1 hypothetical protein CHRY9390_03105 [Chryseobacterium aquaeductus]